MRATRRAFEALDAVELRQQLVDDAVGDAGRVVAALRRDGVELVEEQDARRRRGSFPVQQQGYCFWTVSFWCSFDRDKHTHAAPCAQPVMHRADRKTTHMMPAGTPALHATGLISPNSCEWQRTHTCQRPPTRIRKCTHA